MNEDRLMKDTGPAWVGNRVKKTGGDYTFKGEIVALFQKRSGATRCVVENSDGMLFIFAPKQLEPWDGT